MKNGHYHFVRHVFLREVRSERLVAACQLSSLYFWFPLEKLQVPMAEPGNDQVIQDCKDALLLLRSLKDLLLGPRFEDFFTDIDGYNENRTNGETFLKTMKHLLGGDHFMDAIVSDTLRMIKFLKKQIMALDVNGALENRCEQGPNCIRSKVIKPDEASVQPPDSCRESPTVSEQNNQLTVLYQQSMHQQQLPELELFRTLQQQQQQIQLQLRQLEELRQKQLCEYAHGVFPNIKNSIYATDEFRMFSFKVRPCSRKYVHDWTECPFVHPEENARRRDPRKYHYSYISCPHFRKGICRRGDRCEYAHGLFECYLHPAQYRTRMCKDGTACVRAVCFFAHTHEELRPLYMSTSSAVRSPRSSASAIEMDAAAMSLLPGSLSSVSVMSSPDSRIESPTVSEQKNQLTVLQQQSMHQQQLPELEQLQLQLPMQWQQQRKIQQHQKQLHEPRSMFQELPIDQERCLILRQQQLQQNQCNRSPVLSSIQYAVQAQQELGPGFPEFCALLGCFKTRSIDVGSLQAAMTQLLGDHSKVWPALKMCLRILHTQSIEQWMRQSCQQWLNFLIYITEVLASVGSDSSIFCQLWEAYLANSISIETLKARMEPFLRGNDELWYQFQKLCLHVRQQSQPREQQQQK